MEMVDTNGWLGEPLKSRNGLRQADDMRRWDIPDIAIPLHGPNLGVINGVTCCFQLDLEHGRGTHLGYNVNTGSD